MQNFFHPQKNKLPAQSNGLKWLWLNLFVLLFVALPKNVLSQSYQFGSNVESDASYGYTLRMDSWMRYMNYCTWSDPIWRSSFKINGISAGYTDWGVTSPWWGGVTTCPSGSSPIYFTYFSGSYSLVGIPEFLNGGTVVHSVRFKVKIPINLAGTTLDVKSIYDGGTQSYSTITEYKSVPGIPNITSLSCTTCNNSTNLTWSNGGSNGWPQYFQYKVYCDGVYLGTTSSTSYQHNATFNCGSSRYYEVEKLSSLDSYTHTSPKVV